MSAYDYHKYTLKILIHGQYLRYSQFAYDNRNLGYQQYMQYASTSVLVC